MGRPKNPTPTPRLAWNRQADYTKCMTDGCDRMVRDGFCKPCRTGGNFVEKKCINCNKKFMTSTFIVYRMCDACNNANRFYKEIFPRAIL